MSGNLRLREERAVARLAAFYEDRRRMDAARAMTPRARAGSPAAAEQRDPRFAELDALIADEERYARNRTAGMNAETRDADLGDAPEHAWPSGGMDWPDESEAE